MSAPVEYQNATYTPDNLPETCNVDMKVRPQATGDGPVGNNGAKEVKLRRQMGLYGAISLIVGGIIGSGIFASPANVLKYSGSVGLCLITWTAMGFISILGALCYIELGTMFPNECGGEYSYVRKAFGALPAFVISWVYVVVLRPADFCLIPLVTGHYVMELTGNDEVVWRKLLAAVFMGIILMVNCLSVKWATRVQVFFTIAKLLAIAMIIITGIVRLAQGYTENFKDSFSGTSRNPSRIAYSFYAASWAYSGWNNLNFAMEELKRPKRDLQLSIFIGIPLVTVCYILVNIAYLTVLSPKEIIASSAVAVTLADRLYGVMAWVVPVFVACSTFGATNSTAFTAGRLVYVSARNGHMPNILAMIHKERRTPIPAIAFTCVIGWIMLIPKESSFETLINYFSFATWVFYAATFSALLWLRFKKPDLERPFKVFIGVPIFSLLISIYLVVAPFLDYPLESFYCLLYVLSGIPVYFVFVYYKLMPKTIMDGYDKFAKWFERIGNFALPDSKDEIAG